MGKLSELLEKTSEVARGSEYTHVDLVPSARRLLIRPVNRHLFWPEYCDLAQSGDDKRPNLAEANGPLCPVIVDLLFRFLPLEDEDDDDDLYDVSFLRYLVSCVQQVLLKQFEIAENKIALICCVLESQTWIDTDVDDTRYMCKSIRLQFPNCRIEADLSTQILYPQIIALFRSCNIIGKLRQQPQDDWNKMLDNTAMTKPVVMYGSTDVPGRPERTLSYTWPTIDADVLHGIKDVENLEIRECFDLSLHSDIADNNMQVDDEDDLDEYWLPMILSVNYGRGSIRAKPTNTTPKIKLRVNGKQSVELSDLQLARVFLDMISPERLSERIYWLDVGKVLYNITDGEDEGLQEWIRVTKNLNSKFITADQCEDCWCDVTTSPLTVKTLAWYAQLDSPKRYEAWHADWIFPHLEAGLSGLQTDVCRAFYKLHWLKYAFVPGGRSGVWYKFRGHRWFRDEMGLDIKKMMSTEFRGRYELLRIEYSKQVSATSDDTVKNNLEIKIKKVGKLLENLCKTTQKSLFFKECQELFVIEEFSRVLNQNLDCIGHLNCVSEVCESKVYFRQGKPEDYITKTTGVKIDTNMSWDSPLVKTTMRWFKQLFTDEELLVTFLKYGASQLIGGNPNKYIVCMTGEGDNGKSMVIKALEAAFGDYCAKVPNEVITGSKKGGSGPNPELAQLDASRCAIIDELEDDTLMTGILKKLSGGDSFFGRMCNENGGKIRNTFKIVLVCNKVPKMNSTHKAMRNRFVLFPFLSTWTDDAPLNPEEQIKTKTFKKDPFFDRIIPKLAPAILWIFSQYWGQYYNEGLQMPQIVQDMTREYWSDIDVFEAFKQEFIDIAWKDESKKEQNTDAKLSITEIYREFKPWFQENYTGEKPIQQRDLKLELTKFFGKPSENKYWYGIFLRSQQPITEEKFNGGGKGLKGMIRA